MVLPIYIILSLQCYYRGITLFPDKNRTLYIMSHLYTRLMKRDYLAYFPKSSCYPNQLEAMDAIQDALIKKQIVLFEGACGTGKTLSALAPALHIAKHDKKTVVIATNVHQQMAQFIAGAREIQKRNNLK